MRMKFLGAGDAFGSGGRLNTCFLVNRGERSFLIDCGASAMIAIRRFGVDPNTINTIILSHLHGDHFGGLPFFILDAQLVSRRTRPLTIAGPRGLRTRLDALMEAMFPGSSQVERKFSIELIEFEPETPTMVGGGGPQVTGYLVEHPSGAPSLALRVECDGKVIAYTGDTEWLDVLISVGRDADLLIAEAYWYERKVRYHLDFMTLKERLPQIGAKRLVITHMSKEMLGRLSEVDCGEAASDGLEIEIE
jgi:ribonuclease BN (tRNA processing enzyme)